MVFDFKLKELNVISMYKDPTLEQELEVRNRQVQALRQRLEQLEQNIIEVYIGDWGESLRIRGSTKVYIRIYTYVYVFIRMWLCGYIWILIHNYLM